MAPAHPPGRPGASESPQHQDQHGHGDEPRADGRIDWLRNLLTVSGPAAEMGRFRVAASGFSAIPWFLDLEHEERRLLAPMASGGASARTLAQQLREIIAARHDRVLALAGQPGPCPLDLHRLVPVPPAILQLGDDDPAAQDWLLAHWGTQHGLRHVRLHAGRDRRLRRKAELVYEFCSADWSPWPALRRLRRDWPLLVFALRPQYGDA